MRLSSMLVGLVGILAACHEADPAGVDDDASKQVDGDDTADDDESASSSSSGRGGSTGAASSSSGGVASSDATLADVQIARVWAMQSVAVPLAEDGAAAPHDLPVVAGKDLWVRVFLASAAAANVVVQVRVGAQTFETPWTLGQASTEASLASTPVVAVPASAVAAGTSWSVRVLDATRPVAPDGATNGARFPRDGSQAALGAETVPTPKVVVVPLRWDVDDTHRLPDTGPEAIAALRTQLLAWYPVADVDLTVHDVVPYAGSGQNDGDVDFYDVNDVLYDLRAADHVAPNVHYYGIVAPADSFDDYCFGTCTTGQSYTVTDVGDADIRVGAGVAFTREGAANTFAHELGHLFGRGHSPCHVSSWDPDYPYLNGVIGTWGWNGTALVDPQVATDFMGYCDDQWVSDFTYRGLYERAKALQDVAPNPPRPALRAAPQETARAGLRD